MMVAKPSKVYTKLQGNVDKMNVRLSSQFSHEHLKLSNVHRKIGKKALHSICQHFLAHSFPSHLCDPICKFVYTYYYQIIFDIFFYVHGNIGPKLSPQFPQQGKFFTTEISLQRIPDNFYSKPKIFYCKRS